MNTLAAVVIGLVVSYLGYTQYARKIDRKVIQTDPNKMADRKYHLTDGDKILQALAEETGGRAFFPYHVDDLDQSFQDIGDELRNQYSIAYLPTNYVLDGRYHKIRIEVPEHKGYQVRARRGYFARANANVPTTPNPGGAGIK